MIHLAECTHVFFTGICLCRISWRGPVVLVPGTFCLWFQFFRGGCCSRRGNPCVSCRRGNIWIWWINNMNYISKIQTTSLWRTSMLPVVGVDIWSWRRTMRTRRAARSWPEMKPWKWGGRAREKMLSLLMCFISTVTSYNCYNLQASSQKEPLPFITTILNPWILRSWWWSCWGLWRYGGETSARVEILKSSICDTQLPDNLRKLEGCIESWCQKLFDKQRRAVGLGGSWKSLVALVTRTSSNDLCFFFFLIYAFLM